MATRLTVCIIACFTCLSGALAAQQPASSGKPPARPASAAARPSAAKPAASATLAGSTNPAATEPAPSPQVANDAEKKPEDADTKKPLPDAAAFSREALSNAEKWKAEAKQREQVCAQFMEGLKQRSAPRKATKASDPGDKGGPAEKQKEKAEKEKAEQLQKEEQRSLAACARDEKTSSLTGANVGADLVRTVAQVVVDKVQRQGWVALRDELKHVANCPNAESGGKTKTRYPNLCRVLDTATIQDLVASPEVLLDAAAADLLEIAIASARANPAARDALNVFLTSDRKAFEAYAAARGLKPAAGQIDEALEAAETKAQAVLDRIASAHRLGSDVLIRRLQQLLLQKAREQAAKIECDPAWTSPQQALWVAGMCFVERPSKDALSSCELERWVDNCIDPEDADSAAKGEKVLQFLASAQDVFGTKSGGARIDATVRLLFAMAEAQLREQGNLDEPTRKRALSWLAALEDTLLGLTSKDWVRAVSGATRTVSFVIDPSGVCGTDRAGETDCERRESEIKLLTLLGAIGNYALTYKTGDGDKAQADREKIMGELVDRMVSRTSTERGTKFSIGGSLGFLGGARTDFDAAQVAAPVQLGLGFGLQSYGRGNGGFHLMATLLDVGQYVTIDNSELDVGEPDVESAITLGLTFGGWLWNREVPLYVGAYGGVSPFVREGNQITYQFGIASGFYVPLLDFN